MLFTRRLALVASLAFLPTFAWPASAEPPATAPETAAAQVKTLLVEMDTALKAKDEDGIRKVVKQLPALFKGTQDGAVRSSIAKGLGAVVKQNKMTTARQEALNALVETEDGKEAWKAISSSYPKDDVEDPERWNVEFVKAVGLLHPDGAIDKLLETFRKAKQDDLAAAAVTALGYYGMSKQREAILTEIVKSGKNMVPSQGQGKNPSAEATARWAVLGEKIGKALDMLTGDTVGAAVEWFRRYDDSKKNVKALFKTSNK